MVKLDEKPQDMMSSYGVYTITVVEMIVDLTFDPKILNPVAIRLWGFTHEAQKKHRNESFKAGNQQIKTLQPTCSVSKF